MLNFSTLLPPGHQVFVANDYEGLLVILSYLVASAAGYTALAMADWVTTSRSRRGSELAKLIGAVALGGGIWSMHFLAMLSFKIGIHVHYDPLQTLVSLLIAIAVSYTVMHLIGRESLTAPQYLLASLAAGVGIAAMHYTGMLAMHSIAIQLYDPLLVAVSVVVASLASLAALLLAFRLRGRTGLRTIWLRLLGSLGLGFAIVSMHFTGMAALTLAVPIGFEPNNMKEVTQHLELGMAVALGTLFIILVGLLAAWAGERFHAQRLRLERVSTTLDQISLHDPLTHLLNGSSFIQTVDRAVSQARSGEQFALLILDVDHFKRINDSLGHALGDELLVQVAQRIRAVLDDDLPLARYAGDEFSLLLPLGTRGDSQPLTLRLLEQLRPPFELAGQRFAMTFSLGIAHYPQDGADAGQLLRSAGLAVGHCKRSGRNRSLRFANEFQREADDLLSLEMDLRHALSQGGLHLAYQPIVDPAGHPVALEALVRWQHPTLGALSPERFVRVAEQTGLIADLDGWVMRQACADLAQLHREGYAELRVSVNCSALNLSDRLLPQAIARALQAEDLPPSALIIEVTENALMHSLNVAIELLGEIRSLGVRVSIDDFGSGYSSLAYLSRLPVDSLKVDRAFVRTIPNQDNDMAIASAIIAMAHKLGLKVVAEGVETAEQRHFLHSNDCDFMQGYLFSRPVPLPQLRSWLEQRALAATQPA
ncbi:putative bifunctional diguanylate cyclase/phosphodiesterase [Pseudomonas rhizoryzae]|uniref:putative bifunctional diguanylate cyclase/phosphodiesterase n=1 Tax=Pseudomonas rhizoryzae TaxID=2571129 RepID=UPI0007366D31|nr:EAL domain-containing protein [Pseudomonas rhizoryzae]KTT13902.1 diguanylate cyclase [Pseudomonas psychrotolerans]KTT30320.1 diguanylate cyclase [Pseudomonas psychrotolerans]KTT36739.1 diguanylate cyclase [Pseudomonas psychrotolerans]KTT77674.1 diguanylate cyclase [Pseudomonas psychrotolerans]